MFCCRCMLSNVSLRFVPTRHRVQQGDAHMRKLQQICTRAQNAIFSGDKKQSLILSEPLPGQSTTSQLTGSGQLNHPSRRSPGRRSVLDPTGDLSHQDPVVPRHGMQRTANTLGLKVTAEIKKNSIKKSCVVDKYRRMVG